MKELYGVAVWKSLFRICDITVQCREGDPQSKQVTTNLE